MVKRWVVMIIIFALLVVGGVLETSYTKKSLSWLINSLETLQIEMTENKEKIDTPELIADAYSINIEWEKKLKVLKCLIWHSGVKDVEIGIARIAVYIKENDYKEATAECSALIDYTAHYLDDFKVTLENIL